MSYIGTYLFDVLGMKPEAAMAYLKGSLIGDRFRSFRIQRDKTFDPNLYEIALPEEPSFGRVTFQLKEDGVVSKAYCEGLGWELHTPTRWPPQPAGLHPSEVFFLGPPVFLGQRGVRRDLQVILPEQPVGWYIEAIESYHVVDGQHSKSNLPPLPPAPPPKQKIAPDFEYLG